MYVWGEEGEANSEQALDAADRHGVMPILTVVDVRDMRFGETPEWLVGVPTLLNVQDEIIYKGTAALRKIEEMGKQPHLYTRKQKERRPMGDIRQEIEGVGTMAHRPAVMMRGVEDTPLAGQRPLPSENSALSATRMHDDSKISAADMQNEIDDILKRREQMMNKSQQQQPSSVPLPSMPSDS